MGILNNDNLSFFTDGLKPFIVRDMTIEIFNSLSDEDKKGLIVVTKEPKDAQLYFNGEPITTENEYILDGVPIKPITKVEYDALTDEEKNSETGWLLTDVDGEGSAGNFSEEIYSEEEVRIGTWFGKPLYRRVFNSVTGVLKTETEIGSFPYIDIMITAIGIVKGKSTSYTNIPGMLGYLYFNSAQKLLGCQVTIQDISECPMIVILEYTKTTD